jgi:hypothetical protein
VDVVTGVWTKDRTTDEKGQGRPSTSCSVVFIKAATFVKILNSTYLTPIAAGHGCVIATT